MSSATLPLPPSVGVSVVAFPLLSRSGGAGSRLDTSRVLLIRRRNPPSALHWCFPGGRLESGETIAAAGARELAEETGLQCFQPHELAAFHTTEVIDRDEAGVLRFHYVLLHVIAAVELTADGALPDPCPSDDVDAAQWIPTRELLEGGSLQTRLPPAALYVPMCDDVTRIALTRLGCGVRNGCGAAVAPVLRCDYHRTAASHRQK